MTVFLDTSALFSITKPTEKAHAWAVAEFERLKSEEPPVVITNIVFCEFGFAMNSAEDVRKAIAALGIERMTERDEVLFRAAKAFQSYKKKNKGPKLGVMPDFLIGAAAEVLDVPLMTTNARDFLSYFPTITVITQP